MPVVYALSPFPTRVQKTIFLGGPTPRKNAVSWREEVIKLLEEEGFDGHIFTPEPKDGRWSEQYDDQLGWEDEGLNRADVILFWVPRDVQGDAPEGNGVPMPALTTNDEWGTWKDSGKVIWGSPDWAESTKYQKHYAKELGVPTFNTLKDAVKEAIRKVGEGAERTEGETQVPLHIWSRDDFQAWYKSQLSSGNSLEGFKVKWGFFVGPNKDRLFIYVAHPLVHIKEEGRSKKNECILFRPDISTVCLYKRAEPLTNTKIVLVKEFRTPVRNDESYVYELPGGSSPKSGVDARQTAVDEVSEEVGIALDPARLKDHGSRQMGATLCCYHAHLYSVELSDEELEILEADKSIHGADDEERTTIHIATLGEILQEDLVDWPTLGMIFGAFG